MEEKRQLVVTIEKGYHKINFFTMMKKKATWSYTFKKKNSTGSYIRKR